MKAIVVYTSKYGSSEQYAQWLAEALHCPAKRLRDVNAQALSGYDTVIYGGGLYASGIAGFKKFLPMIDTTRHKTLVLYMVGLTNPADTAAYNAVAERNLPTEWKKRFEVFALRGDQLFSKMSGMHKLMMRMPKAMTEKKPVAERSEEDILFLECYGKDTRYVSREQIEPILQFLQSGKEIQT